MKMEIIKEGHIYSTWYGECDNCYSIVKGTLEDDFKSYKYHKSFKYECPFCKGIMTFYREDITKGKEIKTLIEEMN